MSHLGGDYGGAEDGTFASAPRRPSAAGYVVALVVALAACVGAVAWGWVGVSRAASRTHSFDAPGRATLSLDAAATWTIYAERVGSKPVASEFGALTITITGPDGDVPVQGIGGSEIYSIGNTHGLAIREFTVPAAGDYDIAVGWPDTSPGRSFTVGVNQGLVTGILFAIFGACGLFAFGLVVGIVVAVVTFVRRRRTVTP